MTHAHYKELSGGFVAIGEDTRWQTAIYFDSPQRIEVVGAMVFAYGWNDDFIIAKQHPTVDNLSATDLTVTNYFIIAAATQDVFGPLSFDEFLLKRDEFGVPDNLDFVVQIEP